MNKHSLRSGSMACVVLLFGALAVTAAADPQGRASSSADAAIPPAGLLQPEDLAQTLRSSDAEAPLVLQVGSHVLYAQAHIPGAEYAGAGGQEAGLQALVARVKDLKLDQPIIIYCGCCPWNKCPNVRPAYWQLRTLGFTRVKVLYIADNFGADWVDKGYPVAKGR